MAFVGSLHCRYSKIITKLLWYSSLSYVCVSGFSLGKTPTPSSSTTNNNNDGKHRIVIVGGGWAGYSAAEEISSLCVSDEASSNVEVILLDASKKKEGGGLAGGYRTSKGRPLDVGIHGFWREYQNTFDIMKKIEGIQNLDDILTDYIPSALYSRTSGQVAVAPVMSDTEISTTRVTDRLNKDEITKLCQNPTSIPELVGDLLPPPLDLAITAKFNEDCVLSWQDRVSALGLAGYWADFQQEDETSWKMYDQMSAKELLDRAGVTATLRSEMVDPLLHVLPMCPDYDCSAAAMLSCFHVFALQSKGAFDVRWCRGSIAELIFEPWQTQLKNRGNVQVLNGKKVTSITNDTNEGNQTSKKKYSIQFGQGVDEEDNDPLECDAIILAVGATSIKYIAQSSPPLHQCLSAFEQLRGVTCVAVRLFLNPYISESKSPGTTYQRPDIAEAMKDSPIAVCGPGILLPELEETGFCIYDLNRMHDEFKPKTANDEEEKVAVLEVDFYRADSIVDKSDEEIAKIALKAVQSALQLSNPIDAEGEIIDLAVIRARNAVSHFAPGCATATSSLSSIDGVKIDNGLYLAGDWVDRTGHASWSTEKSVVTGRQAAQKFCSDFQVVTNNVIRKNDKSNIIPAATDTPYLQALRQSVQLARKTIFLKDSENEILPPTPWVITQQTLSKFLAK